MTASFVLCCSNAIATFVKKSPILPNVSTATIKHSAKSFPPPPTLCFLFVPFVFCSYRACPPPVRTKYSPALPNASDTASAAPDSAFEVASTAPAAADETASTGALNVLATASVAASLAAFAVAVVISSTFSSIYGENNAIIESFKPFKVSVKPLYSGNAIPKISESVSFNPFKLSNAKSNIVSIKILI